MKYILVNYQHDPSWVKEYSDDYLIYDRSEKTEWTKNIPRKSLIFTENVGNVDYDRLSYLIENYNHLPDVFVLAKSNLFKYITKEEFESVKDNKVFTPLLTQHHKVYEPICRYVDGMYEEVNNSWYVSQFWSKFESYNEWAEYMGLPQPENLQFAPGGNYILTKETIHKHPKSFYKKMKDTLGYTQLPAEAQFVERSYLTIWL